MLASGVAVWKVWCESTDARPAWMAGHSLGEYSALVAAESLGFADALKLVELRGQLMQAANCQQLTISRPHHAMGTARFQLILL